MSCRHTANEVPVVLREHPERECVVRQNAAILVEEGSPIPRELVGRRGIGEIDTRRRQSSRNIGEIGRDPGWDKICRSHFKTRCGVEIAVQIEARAMSRQTWALA